MDRQRLAAILSLALPIVGGMVSQNVLNLVDTAMVGTLGAAALGAVGLASFATFLSQAFITGLSSGVQAMAARRLGEQRLSEVAVPLNGGLLLAVALGLPLSVLVWLVVPSVFPLLNDDPEVIAVGVPYWRVRLLGVVAVGVNFSFRGYWNGVSQSRIYLRTLVVMHVCNLVLNYLLIFGKFGFPELGATGAGLGTALSTWVGAVYYLAQGWAYAREGGFLAGLPSVDTLRTMLRLSLPTGLQQLFFAAGYTALFWIVGKVGTEELGAANVLLNVTLVAILPGLGLGLAAGSLVGQALGRGDPADARAWGWDVVKVGVAGMTILALPMILIPDAVLGVFLHEAGARALAVAPLRLTGAFIFLDATGLILLNALIGAGDTRRAASISVALQWGVGLPMAYVAGPVLGGSLFAVWATQVGYRAVQAVVLASVWRGDGWVDREV